MRFKKISITKRGVLLIRDSKDVNGAVEEVKLESPERPKPSFDDALQGFTSFVRDLLTDAVDLEDSTLTITTLNLSEDTNGNRGLIVTAIVPVPNAHDKPLVLNTPLVREGNGELNLSNEATILDDAELKLIKIAEAEAEKYVKGERLPASADVEKKPTSKNAQEFDEAAAHASSASTRKPDSAKKGGKAQGKRKHDKAPEKDNTVAFPAKADTVGALTDEQVRQLLLSVERDAPVEAIAGWTAEERQQAVAWAEARQKEIIGTLAEAKMPREPECVINSSTLPLKAEEAVPAGATA